mmetsp:Transcript_27263/g.69317  ORF Transcript_27263/g.69317 Transcript_27263/m.69317 type:complete len:261 (-) Transcript_27263:72-854(-)
MVDRLVTPTDLSAAPQVGDGPVRVADDHSLELGGSKEVERLKRHDLCEALAHRREVRVALVQQIPLGEGSPLEPRRVRQLPRASSWHKLHLRLVVGACEGEVDELAVDGIVHVFLHVGAIGVVVVAHASDEVGLRLVDELVILQRRRLAKQPLPHRDRELERQRVRRAQADADERAEHVQLPQRLGRRRRRVEHVAASVVDILARLHVVGRQHEQRCRKGLRVEFSHHRVKSLTIEATGVGARLASKFDVESLLRVEQVA